MTSTTRPCLIATAIFLSACSLPVSVEVDCAWAKPILFSEATKTWLAERTPWPANVLADLERIARHNDKFKTFCGETESRPFRHNPGPDYINLNLYRLVDVE